MYDPSECIFGNAKIHLAILLVVSTWDGSDPSISRGVHWIFSLFKVVFWMLSRINYHSLGSQINSLILFQSKVHFKVESLILYPIRVHYSDCEFLSKAKSTSKWNFWTFFQIRTKVDFLKLAKWISWILHKWISCMLQSGFSKFWKSGFLASIWQWDSDFCQIRATEFKFHLNSHSEPDFWIQPSGFFKTLNFHKIRVHYSHSDFLSKNQGIIQHFYHKWT